MTFPSRLAFQDLEESRKTIPRYLFKCYSPRSGSRCTTRFIRPRAEPAELGPHTLHVLSCHLTWGRYLDSEFVSWTDSILVALVYAIRKLEGQDRRDRSRNGVCIAILDVNLVRDKVAIYPANALLDAFDFPDSGPFKRHRFLYEFLVHGSVNNDSTQTFSAASMDDLIAKGFYEVFDCFQKPDKTLWRRVENLRHQSSGRSLIGTLEFDLIRGMSSVFDGEFQLPVALALAAMLHVNPDSDDSIRALSKDFINLPTPSSYWCRRVDSISQLGGDDVSYYHTLMLKVCAYRVYSS